MNSFDDDVRRAVRPGSGEPSLVAAGDEGVFEQIASTFRGRMRFWVALMWLMTAVWAGVAIWAAISFFRATTPRDWIMYATIFLWGLIAVAMLKMWNWMEMNRCTHSREIKRLELQMAQLRERLERR
jgi:FtsH-binding integral membrane protein